MKTLLSLTFVLIAAISAGQNNAIDLIIPLPLPEWSAPLGVSENDHHVLMYDISTATESVYDTNRYPETSQFSSTESYIPSGLETVAESAGLKSFTDLKYVSNTTAYPASANVKLFIRYPSSASIYVGSGVMVSKNVVLTAGHCIYDKNLGGWAKWIKVVPGYTNHDEPFGFAMAKKVYAWNDWTIGENFDWDMGVILLDGCIGLHTGYFGIGTYHNAFFTSNNFHNYSYPSDDPYNGLSMYYRHGKFDNVTEHMLKFNNRSYKGQSGSGHYYIDANGNRCNYSVLSHGNNSYTGCTRITSAKFDFIRNTIDQNQQCPISNVIEGNRPQQSLTFLLYPNPAVDNLNLCPDDPHRKYKITICDMLGNVVYQNTPDHLFQRITVSVSNLENGCYFVTLTDGNESGTGKFIKSSF